MIVLRTRLDIMFWTFGGLILVLLCLGIYICIYKFNKDYTAVDDDIFCFASFACAMLHNALYYKYKTIELNRRIM